VEKKKLLAKLDGVVRTEKESQQRYCTPFLMCCELFHEFQVLISTWFTYTREFSRRAMERLVLIAYEKYMVIILKNHKDTSAS
jgi:hypothetical protein